MAKPKEPPEKSKASNDALSDAKRIEAARQAAQDFALEMDDESASKPKTTPLDAEDRADFIAFVNESYKPGQINRAKYLLPTLKGFKAQAGTPATIKNLAFNIGNNLEEHGFSLPSADHIGEAIMYLEQPARNYVEAISTGRGQKKFKLTPRGEELLTFIEQSPDLIANQETLSAACSPKPKHAFLTEATKLPASTDNFPIILARVPRGKVEPVEGDTLMLVHWAMNHPNYRSTYADRLQLIYHRDSDGSYRTDDGDQRYTARFGGTLAKLFQAPHIRTALAVLKICDVAAQRSGHSTFLMNTDYVHCANAGFPEAVLRKVLMDGTMPACLFSAAEHLIPSDVHVKQNELGMITPQLLDYSKSKFNTVTFDKEKLVDETIKKLLEIGLIRRNQERNFEITETGVNVLDNIKTIFIGKEEGNLLTLTTTAEFIDNVKLSKLETEQSSGFRPPPAVDTTSDLNGHSMTYSESSLAGRNAMRSGDADLIATDMLNSSKPDALNPRAVHAVLNYGAIQRDSRNGLTAARATLNKRTLTALSQKGEIPPDDIQAVFAYLNHLPRGFDCIVQDGAKSAYRLTPFGVMVKDRVNAQAVTPAQDSKAPEQSALPPSFESSAQAAASSSTDHGLWTEHLGRNVDTNESRLQRLPRNPLSRPTTPWDKFSR